MRTLALLLCLSCAVTNPPRDELLTEGQEPSDALSLTPQTAPTADKTTNAPSQTPRCPAEVVYNLCAADRYRVEGIAFENNSAALLFPASTASINELLRSLLQQPDARVVIEVHTDAQGADSYNLVMSQKRAEALVEYLVKLGAPAAQIEAKGMGETRPLNAGKTAEERRLNRRIELALNPK